MPTVAPNGVAKTGAKLLAWMSVVNGTYMKDAKYWTSDYAFNLTRSLFGASPEMEATWDQAVHSDARVVKLRDRGEWRQAWELVLGHMKKAHTGDRHASQRLACKTRGEFLQHGDKTVATVAQALVEEEQSREQMKLWNGLATLYASLEQDWLRGPSVSMFGLDPLVPQHQELHVHIMGVLQTWKDKAQAYRLYGSLRSEIQTLFETDRGAQLLAHEITHQQVRSDAIAYEGREKAHLLDLSRKMKLLGVKPLDSDRGTNQAARQRATARQLQGSQGAPHGRGRGR